MNSYPRILYKKVEALEKEVEALRLENSVLLSYNEKKTVELGMDEEEKKKRKKEKKSVATLNPDQKYEIANIVHEDLLAEMEAHRKNSEKMIDTLRAVLEETEIRIGELKRDSYEFKRDVVVGAENNRTGKVMAEKVIRYFEDKQKQVDAIIEKLRLKNSNLKSQISKLQATLTQKEDVGEALHYIDFHQLQIENKQYVAKIEERNKELSDLKTSSSKTTVALNEYKRRLNVQLADEQWLLEQLDTKKKLQIKFEEEQNRITRELDIERRGRNKLRMQVEEALEMPDIEEYILQKRDMQNLQAVKKNWEKKVQILEMSARSTSLHCICCCFFLSFLFH